MLTTLDLPVSASADIAAVPSATLCKAVVANTSVDLTCTGTSHSQYRIQIASKQLLRNGHINGSRLHASQLIVMCDFFCALGSHDPDCVPHFPVESSCHDNCLASRACPIAHVRSM